MIQIHGNPAVLRRPIPHHNAELSPLRDTLLFEIFITFGSDAGHHRLIQHRTGIGSWELRLADGRSFHFRAVGDYVVVKDSWFNGHSAYRLHSEQDCINFIRGLVAKKKAA